MDWTEIVGYIISGAFVLLGIIAAVRIAVKTYRGERIDVPAVGVVKDLPDSVTGINKHLDSEALNNNQQKKGRRIIVDMRQIAPLWRHK